MMLKGISPVLSPDMLKILCEMGHFDEIVISDGNFPAYTKNGTVLESSSDVIDVLNAILPVFPVCEAAVMAVDKEDMPFTPPVFEKFEEAFLKNNYKIEIIKEKRQDFYDRAKKAYAVIHTKDNALYANILIKKGVV